MPKMAVKRKHSNVDGAQEPKRAKKQGEASKSFHDPRDEITKRAREVRILILSKREQGCEYEEGEGGDSENNKYYEYC
jgi:hypothetical protein